MCSRGVHPGVHRGVIIIGEEEEDVTFFFAVVEPESPTCSTSGQVVASIQ